MKKLEMDFIEAYDAHVRSHGAKNWKALKAIFPKMPSANFWRRKLAAKEFMAQADAERLAEEAEEAEEDMGTVSQQSQTGIQSAARVLEQTKSPDSDDPAELAAYVVRMAQNLENSAVAMVDGRPRIVDAAAYAAAARLILAAGHVVNAANKT